MERSRAVTRRIGYVGLGNMGGGIATRLTRSGVQLIAYDIDPKAVAQIVAEGGRGATSLREIAAETDIVIVCVRDSEQVIEVVLGEGGILESSRPGQVVIIQSTVIPQTILRVANAAGERGVDLIDAPVSGSFDDRLNGTLAVIVGGDEAVVERCRPLLEVIGSKIRHVGPLGSGQVAKLANNAIMHTTRLAAIEAMQFAAAYGVSEHVIRTVAKVCSADSWVLDNWAYFDAQTMLAIGDDAPQIRNAIEAAEDLGIDLPLCRGTAAIAPSIESGRRQLLQRVQGLPSEKQISARATGLGNSEHFGGSGVEEDLVQMEQLIFASPGEPTLNQLSATRTDVATISGDASLTVTLDGQVTTIAWKAGELMLDALQAAGLNPPYSCRSGSCGACICTLESGDIELRHNEVLEEADLAEGLVLACQSVACSPHIKVSF